jgi:hypothetical protein
VTIRDPQHHILYANRAALRQMGFASLEEIQRTPPLDVTYDLLDTAEAPEPDEPQIAAAEG